jgi:hypothetical protein
MDNAVFWGMTPRRFFRTDVSEDCIVSVIRVERISELETTLAETVTEAQCEETLPPKGRH